MIFYEFALGFFTNCFFESRREERKEEEESDRPNLRAFR